MKQRLAPFLILLDVRYLPHQEAVNLDKRGIIYMLRLTWGVGLTLSPFCFTIPKPALLPV